MAKQNKKSKAQLIREISKRKRAFFALGIATPIVAIGVATGIFYGVKSCSKSTDPVPPGPTPKPTPTTKGTVVFAEGAQPEDVSIDKSSISVKKGKESHFALNLPELHTIKTITLEVNESEVDPSYIEISDNYVTVSKDAMIANKIVITYLELKEQEPSDMSLTKYRVDIEVGESFDISAHLTYNTNTQYITWSKQDPSQTGGDATIKYPQTESDAVNTITATAAGTVEIVAECCGVTRTCTVYITQPVVEAKANFDTTSMTNISTSLSNRTVLSTESEPISFTAALNSGSDKTGWFYFAYQSSTGISLDVPTDKVTLSSQAKTPDIQVNLSTIFDKMAECGETETTLKVTFVEYVPTITSITVSGDRNIDINSTNSITFTAKNQDSEDITSYCTFTLTDSSLGTFSGNTLTLSETATSMGGYTSVKASYNEIISEEFDISIATFSKLKTDSLHTGYAWAEDAATGDIVIPARFYLGSWIDIKYIARAGFTSENITGVVLGANIERVGVEDMSPFGPNITKLIAHSDNPNFKTPEGSNCLINTSNVLIYGCKGTDFDKVEAYSGSITLGTNSFAGSNIESVKIPNNVTSIGSSAFSGCTSLTTVTVSNSPTITEIGNSAFYGCSAMTSITLPSTLTTIGNSAFNSCAKIKDITFPSTLTSIGAYCFEGCERLTEATFSLANQKWIQSTDESVLAILNTTTITSNATNLKNTTSGLTGYNWCTTGIKIVDEAYKTAYVNVDTSGLTEAGLTSIVVSETYVQNNSSTNTINLQYDYISSAISGVLTIKNNKGNVVRSGLFTFEQYSESAKIVMDNQTEWTDKLVDQDTLYVTFEVTYFSIDENGKVTANAQGKAKTGTLTVPKQVMSSSNSLVDVTGIADNGCAWAQATTVEFEAPAQITTLGNNAFYDCANLTSCPIDDPNDDKFTYLVSIGDEAFEYPNFTTVNIPKSVQTIGEYAFGVPVGSSKANPITTVNVDVNNSQLTTIGERAFQYSKITSFNIPKKTTYIGSAVFLGVTTLTTATFGDTSGTWYQLNDDKKKLIIVTGSAETNATNFKNTSSASSATGKNWGSGIAISSEAAKYAKVSWNYLPFYYMGVDINWQTATTTVLNRDGDRTITIPYTSESGVGDVTGDFVVYDSTIGKEIYHTQLTFPYSTEESSVTVDIPESAWTDVTTYDTFGPTFTKSLTFARTSWKSSEENPEFSFTCDSKYNPDPDTDERKITLNVVCNTITGWPKEKGCIKIIGPDGSTVLASSTFSPASTAGGTVSVSLGLSGAWSSMAWTNACTFELSFEDA